MKKDNKSRSYYKILCVLCLTILIVFMLSICVRLSTREILVNRLGISNQFTRFILHEEPISNSSEGALKNDKQDDKKQKQIAINWAELYPFADDSQKDYSVREFSRTEKIIRKVMGAENRLTEYATDYLIGYKKIVEAANEYKTILRWNHVSYSEYNGIIRLDDGYLSSFGKKIDVTEPVNSTEALNSFCQSKGINFLYVQAPCKISKYEDIELTNTVDFSNQNADDFLQGLKNADVDVYDIRDTIHEENLPHHELFYRTDHHWRAETGLWASKHILEDINTQYEYDADDNLLDTKQFDKVEYKEWFLGSQGKKVTLSATSPDDFSLFFPKYQTNIHYVVPDFSIDLTGDFSVTYDMTQVEEKDYYNKSPYHAYNYGDHPLTVIENKLSKNNLHVLVIHDSFGDCVVPFLALGVNRVSAIDLRYFSGSLLNYIDQEKPDIAIVLYDTSEFTKSIDWSSHNDLFDFR